LIRKVGRTDPDREETAKLAPGRQLRVDVVLVSGRAAEMLQGRIGRTLLLGAVVLGACAPRAVLRGQVSGADATPDEPNPGAALDADPTGDLDGPAPSGPDAAADLPPPPPDRAPSPDTGGAVPDTGNPAGDGGAHKNALLVVATPATLPTDDAKLQMRLAGRGFTVKIGDDDGEATQADGMDLVVLSGTSASSTLAGKYAALPVPVIVLEPNIYGQMKMTGATKATDFDQGTANQITIVDAAHPLAAGQKMTVAVATTGALMTWGVPAMTADRVATVAGSTTHWAVFAYDANKMMVGAMAPARRVGLFIANSTADRLNPAGWQIFDAAVDWCVGP
jgi:hypothetical protein